MRLAGTNISINNSSALELISPAAAQSPQTGSGGPHLTSPPLMSPLPCGAACLACAALTWLGCAVPPAAVAPLPRPSLHPHCVATGPGCGPALTAAQMALESRGRAVHCCTLLYSVYSVPEPVTPPGGGGERDTPGSCHTHTALGGVARAHQMSYNSHSQLTELCMKDWSLDWFSALKHSV